MPPIMSSGTIIAPFQGDTSNVQSQSSNDAFGGMASPFSNNLMNALSPQAPIGMFRQPTILSAPPTSGPIISSGTILSNDGTIISSPMSSYQIPTPTRTPSSLTDHTCKGRGGSSCGCGGSCVGNLPSQNFENSEDTLSLDDFDFNRDILERTVGSWVELESKDENGFRDTTRAEIGPPLNL